MKRVKIAIGILLFFLFVQAAVILDASPVRARVLCDDLALCQGDYGCPDMGSHQGGCILFCNDGGWAWCQRREGQIE